MRRPSSLSSIYSSVEAFVHRDPHVRIAAIHHAARNVVPDVRLPSAVFDMLQDDEQAVARYAAVTLAQSGEKVGLEYLVRAIRNTRDLQREQLNRCLRNCTRFPFAILLNELFGVESIGDVSDSTVRESLDELLYGSLADLSARCEQDRGLSERFLRVLVESHVAIGNGKRMRLWLSADTIKLLGDSNVPRQRGQLARIIRVTPPADEQRGTLHLRREDGQDVTVISQTGHVGQYAVIMLCTTSAPCPSCAASRAGSASETCEVCGGSGLVDQCRGVGRLLCPLCHGKTIAVCNVCNNTGQCSSCHHVSRRIPIMEGGVCPDCEGAEECSECHGTGYRDLGNQRRSLWVACGVCEGRGLCVACDGSGKCAECNGSGICPHCEGGCMQCKGAGYVTCQACHGTGWKLAGLIECSRDKMRY